MRMRWLAPAALLAASQLAAAEPDPPQALPPVVEKSLAPPELPVAPAPAREGPPPLVGQEPPAPPMPRPTLSAVQETAKAMPATANAGQTATPTAHQFR